MSNVFDCFTFFNELDLLELRINILNDFVDYFVLIEADKTFSGKNKPYYFLENKHKFKNYEDKIINFSIKMDDLDNQWDREIYQRNSIKNALINICYNDDIIFISDVDEIPNFDNINLKEIEEDTLYICEQDFYYYYLNAKVIDSNKDFWEGSRFTTMDVLKNTEPNSLRDIRNSKVIDKIKYVKNGGWHFSFLGGEEQIKYKIESYSHQEFNHPFVLNNIKSNIENLNDPFYRKNISIETVELSKETHPKYIVENQEKFRSMIWN